MQSETLHNAVDDAILGRRIRPESFAHTTKEAKQLANHDFDNRDGVFAKLGEAGALDDNVPVPRQARRNGVANDDLHHAQTLLIDFANEITLVSSRSGVCGKEANHECICVYVTHWSMPQTKIGFRYCADLAGRHFDHFQSRL